MSFWVLWSEQKWCGYESIYFLTDLSQVKAVFLYQFRKVITLINNDSIDQKVKLDRSRDSVQKQRVLIKDLNQVARIADLTTENSLIAGPD